MTLTDACAEGFLWNGTPTGSIIQLGELDCYVATPKAKKSNTAILFIHDIFGIQFVNNKLLCDRLAAQSGIPVYMPDYFVTKSLGVPGNITMDFREFLGMFPTLDNLKRVEQSIKDLNSLGKTEIGAIGYCWGGKYSLHFGQKGLKVAIGAHPSRLEPDLDIAGIKVPTLLLLAEKDQSFEGETRTRTLELLKMNQVELAVEEFPGTTHGFAVRGDEQVVKDARDKACADAASFFDKHLNK
ncbi:hypothetical protein HDV06_000857 [Boothiomyces sp. JEL0866]|nr:hypothetical protein HDV06_000857 [Boothiomyces sp. JEL0866]